jgi:hypothetical protein
MYGKTILGAAFVLGLALAASVPILAEEAPRRADAAELCKERCLECERVCQETLAHCTDMGGKHVEGEHLRLMIDCADICHTTASFVMHRSEFMGAEAQVCGEVCARCAASCERVGADEHMKGCVDACKRCADACRKMHGG